MALTRKQINSVAHAAIAIKMVGNKKMKPMETLKDVQSKRKADKSPDGFQKKRSAFGDLTNASAKQPIFPKLMQGLNKISISSRKPLRRSLRKSRKSDLENSEASTSESGEFLTPQESGPEDFKTACDSTLYSSTIESSIDECSSGTVIGTPSPPDGVPDFDKETWNDPFQMSRYCMEIFEYYKSREPMFAIKKYLDRQPEINKQMRAVLVDWLVEVQESFELNHETLYLAVKLIDMYLMRVTVHKEALQLLGATAVFIACKYDERIPPLVDDFLYICDDAYCRKDLLHMECKILKTIDYDLGIPISYRFLRRYARCAKVTMEILTLARYILELSLMEYDFIEFRDSMMAAAALLLALKVKNMNWNSTFEYYSGFKVSDIYDLTYRLHAMMQQRTNDQTKTIRNKYSHKVFFEVALIPMIEDLKL